jgi:hypothetical protein
MPEFTLKEVRLPELHLPEIKRDDIVRSLSGIRIRDVDLAIADRRKLFSGRAAPTLPWRKAGLSSGDLGKLIAATVTAVRFIRPATPKSSWPSVRALRGKPISRSLVAIVRPAPRRSRRRFALAALIVGAIAGWVVLSNPANRVRLNSAARAARRRIDEMRFDRQEGLDLDVGEPVSVTTSDIPATTGGAVDAAEGEIAISAREVNDPA